MSNDFGVRDDKAEALQSRLDALGVQKPDLLERFVRAQGRGGQNVNKNATAVYLKHLPTGIEVKAQMSRSQALNRFFARRILAQKLEAKSNRIPSKEQQRIERQRKQKARRRRRAKTKSVHGSAEDPT